MSDQFTHRIAGLEDLDALHELMARSISQNQSDFLTPEQVAASDKVMGLGHAAGTRRYIFYHCERRPYCRLRWLEL